MDHENRGSGGAGEMSEAVEDDGHLRARVLFRGMAADEGVEDEQTGTVSDDGCLESVELIRETNASFYDHVHG
jgi:hypothetical protein